MIDLTGQRFYKLTVIKPQDSKDWEYYDTGRRKHRKWECLCDCGNTTFASTGDLRAGKRVSCGCSRKEMKRNTSFSPLSKQAYSVSKRDSKTRGISYNLTYKTYVSLVKKPCYYCDAEASGIDRVDSDQGYEIDNVVPSCVTCNRMKSNTSQQEFFAKIEKIYLKHLSQQS